MQQRFSGLDRGQTLETLGHDVFDLLIIGGGITGAGIALDAAQRGLKVALIEQKDFAWGTSSRSTKLIHGGLRYLKQLELSLVHEVGRERATVYRNARHLVRPEKMLLPIIENGSLSKNLSSLGLWVYDRLAGVEAQERRIMLSKEATLKAEPLLRAGGLKGGGLYYEYRTDDARLTIEILKTALGFGAVCLNYTQAQSFLYDAQNQVQGVTALDVLGKQSFEIKAKTLVNAAGPWVDTLRKIEQDGVKGKRLQLTKGVHLVLPFFKLPLSQSVYFDVAGDAGRMCFAIPRQGITYVGTTDTLYDQAIESPEAKQEDVSYILAACNAMFPSAKLSPEDVISTWAGLRPLIHQEGRSASELSRKDEIFETTSGMLSIAGGKLTGYRKMAERIVNRVCKKLGLSLKCQTKDLILQGGDFKDEAALQHFVALQAGEARQVEIPATTIQELVLRYGRATEWIINRAYERYHEIPDAWQRLQRAELEYALAFESVYSPADYLIRRSGRLYFERPLLERLYPLVRDYLAEVYAWSPEERAYWEADYLAAYEGVMAWSSEAAANGRISA